MTRHAALVLLGALLARPLVCQSIIFPTLLDRHVIHAITKPVVSLGVYAGLRGLGVPKTLATVSAIVGPGLASNIYWETKAPGHWRDPLTFKDDLADSFAASLSLILLRMRGWKRVLATALWAAVEIWPVRLNKWARP